MCSGALGLQLIITRYDIDRRVTLFHFYPPLRVARRRIHDASSYCVYVCALITHKRFSSTFNYLSSLGGPLRSGDLGGPLLSGDLGGARRSGERAAGRRSGDLAGGLRSGDLAGGPRRSGERGAARRSGERGRSAPSRMRARG